jgi:hypothetical protein
MKTREISGQLLRLNQAVEGIKDPEAAEVTGILFLTNSLSYNQ